MGLEKNDEWALRKILDKIETLEEIGETPLEDFLNDRIKQLASAMAFLNIGELASKHLSRQFIKSEPSLPYHEMRGMRNTAAHEYDALRFDKIWYTIKRDVPELKNEIQKILEKNV